MKNFARSAAALAAIGIIAKAIGALYRVPLTNIVGAEGMGLYQMVFPLYTVLLAFCGGGITSALSRVVAKYTALGNDRAAERALVSAFVPLIAVSAILTAAVALLRNVISGIQGNSAAGIAYLALCPSLFLASGISVLRGFFQGRNMMLPSGISQLLEQIVKLALGLYLARLLYPRGVSYAVCGALIGVSVSEAAALLYLAVRYVFYARRNKRVVTLRAATDTEAASEFAAAQISDKALRKEIYMFALPVTLGSLILPVTQMIDSALVINLLMYSGAPRADATALFGLFVGPVGTLINMPAVIIMSVSVAFLPALTSAVERGEKDEAGSLTRSAAKWIILFVVPVAFAFFLFPSEICGALYSRGLDAAELEIAARLLRVQAISVFYVGILQLGTTVLQAYNKSHRPVINLVIGACVKVGFTPLFVRFIGIEGAAFSTAACYAVAATLDLWAAYRCAPIRASLRDAFVLPVVFSALGSAAFFGMLAALAHVGYIPPLWKTVIAAAAFLAVYAFIFLFKIGDGHSLAVLKSRRAAFAHGQKRRKK